MLSACVCRCRIYSFAESLATVKVNADNNFKKTLNSKYKRIALVAFHASASMENPVLFLEKSSKFAMDQQFNFPKPVPCGGIDEREGGAEPGGEEGGGHPAQHHPQHQQHHHQLILNQLTENVKKIQ